MKSGTNLTIVGKGLWKQKRRMSEHTDEPVEGGWVALSASSVNYGKVIFVDIPKTYPLENITVRFENAKGIVVGPDDFIGVYKIGFQNTSECLLKGVLHPEDKVIFEAEELQKLDETEVYQFVYVSSEENIYGASTPFRLQPPNEDLFAEIWDDNFLVVRSKLKEENMNLEKGMHKADVRGSILSNRVCVVEQQNAQLKEENRKLKKEIMKLKCDLQAEVENNRNHIVEEQLKEENQNLKKEIEKLKSDVWSTVISSRNCAVNEENPPADLHRRELGEKDSQTEAVTQSKGDELRRQFYQYTKKTNPPADLHRRELEEKRSQAEAVKQRNNLIVKEVQQQKLQETLRKKFIAKLCEMRQPPKFLNDDSEIHEETSTSVNFHSSETTSLLKNHDVPPSEIVGLRIQNGLLTKEITELEKKITEQNITHMETVRRYHRKIEVLNEQISNSSSSGKNNSEKNPLTNMLKRELEKKESEVKALKQSEILVRREYREHQEKLDKKINELLIDEAQLANKASKFEKVLFFTKQELEKALSIVEDLEAEKKDLELKVMELEERFDASKAFLARAAKTMVRNQELISKLTEHKELVAKQMNKMSSEHCEAMEVLKTEKDLIIKDLTARLDEASIIFKQQYRDIEKLRRTMRQLNAKKTKIENESASVKKIKFPESSFRKYVSDDDVSPRSSPKNASVGAVNDSDTGEHVELLGAKSESFGDDKNDIEQEDAKNVPSHLSPIVFSKSVRDDSLVIDVESQEKVNPSQLSSKQHGSPLEEYYFGVAYTAQPTFTYQPFERPL